ncbi:MAG: hypothetical protein Q8N61_01745, partial [bacterium]|nr:hypothetical protein [bacterium]
MKLFGSRFFILFLILTVSLFFFSAKAAYAGGVIDAIGSVFSAIVTVLNTVTNIVIGTSEFFIGTLISNPLASDGECRLQNLEQNVFQVFGSSCNTSASIVITPTGDDCTFSYQPRFYIPEKDVGFIGGGTQCDRITINENNNNVALYRFVKPSNISQSELSDWYFQIKNTLGNGFLILDDPPTWDQPLYHQSADSGSLVTLPYYTACSGNVCDKIADFSIPPDSYVVYAAKMLGNYIGINTYDYGNGIQCDVYPGLNKFLDTDNASRVLLPDSSAWLGNALVGPIKTGPCPATPPPPPPSPTPAAASNATSWNVSCSQNNVSWTDNSNNETQFGIELSTDRGATWPTWAGWVGANVTSFSHTGLSPLTIYTYRIRSSNAAGYGTPSNIAETITPACSIPPPSTPTITLVNPGCSGTNPYIDLDWTDSSNTTNYVVYRNDVGRMANTGTQSSFRDTSVSNSTSYSYKVTAQGPGGEGSWSNTVSPTTPNCAPAAAPTLSFSASPTSITQGNSSTLSWNTSNASSCWGSGGGIDGWKSTGGNETVWPSSNTTYYMECWNSDGASSGVRSATVNVGGAPASVPSVNISADDTNISYNTATTIRWSSSNTTSCTVSPSGWTGTSGAQSTGNLTSSRTYTANCSGPGGSASDSVAVNVIGAAPSPTLSFSANPTSITQGDSSTLSWSASNASSCYGSGGGIDGWKNTNGNETVWPSSNTTYYMECWNDAGTSSGVRSATVNVGGAPVPGAPTLNLSADNTNISYNTGTTLRWNSSNTTSCTASGDWSGSRPLNDSRDTGDLTSSKTYNLTCSGPGGSAFDSVTVNVGGAPVPAPTLSFWADPSSITQGNSSTLSWSTSNASSCYGSGGGIDGWKSSTGGNETVWPSSNTTYYMECWNSAGASSGVRSATVNVSAPPP